MSVINNMLLDLDKRQGRAGTAPAAGHAAVRSIDRESPWAVGRHAQWAMALLAAAALALWWFQGRDRVTAAPAEQMATYAVAPAPLPQARAAADAAPRAPQLRMDMGPSGGTAGSTAR